LENPADYPRLDSIIRRESYLQQQQGRLERNSCRQPGISTGSRSVADGSRTGARADRGLLQPAQPARPRLGPVRSTSDGYGGLAQAQLYSWSADVQHGRGVYNARPELRRVSLAESRWRLRFSARYTF
jgi:hypothetical protein